MGDNTQVAELLLEIFGGNPYHAIGKTAKKGHWYEPVEEPLTVELLEAHLDQKVVLGSYPVSSEDNTVRWLGWDVDAAENLAEARRIVITITNEIQHLPYIVEFSGGKGYHILLFLEEPLPASKAKAYAEGIRDMHKLPKIAKRGSPHVECYPKQAEVRGLGKGSRQKLGNLLKIPLGQHLTSHNTSVFVDMDNGWEDGPELPPEELLRLRIDGTMLSVNGGDEVNRMDKLAFAIASEWADGERHNIALFLSGYLASQNWHEDQAVDLMTRICQYRNDPELDNRLETVHNTFVKASKGGVIAGYQRLADLLPPTTMGVLVQLVAELAAPDTAKKIEKIRFAKGPIWKKEEQASALVWSTLTDPEMGRMLRTQGGQIYWFSEETKTTIDLSSQRWSALLYQMFRLNISESFGRHVKIIIEMRALLDATLTRMYRGSQYDGRVLRLNLGDKRVWVLNGETIEEGTNGDDGILFITNEWRKRVPTPNFEKPIDVWDNLVDDINFAKGAHTPIPGAEQAELLKAWILATFFREELPTRPILTMLGDAGSGKTTAAKRIVQLLEGTEQNVLSVEEDKPDFWRSVVAQHRVFVLDNLEQTRARWLISGLDRIATGSVIEIRKLYETNAVYRIEPDCFVVLTAVNMPFSKDTLFQRLLTVNMDKLTTYIPQRVYEQKMKADINGLWGDLMLKLNRVVATLLEVPDANIAVNLRMADFAMFCKRIKKSGVITGKTLESGLAVLGNAQQLALAHSEHSAFPLIREWVEAEPEEAGKYHTTNELYAVLSRLANRNRRAFRWKDSRGLASHIRAMEAVLVQNLGCQINPTFKRERGRDLKGYRFRPLGEERIGAEDARSED